MNRLRQTLAQLIAGRGFVVQPVVKPTTRFSAETIERATLSKIGRRAPVSAKYAETHRRLREEVKAGDAC